MSVFLCAVSTEKDRPTAYALFEQSDTEAGRHYSLRDLGHFGDEDPVAHLQNRLAADEQMVGRVTVLTTGGQKAAETLHKGGLTAVAIETEAPRSRDGDTLAVTEQQLVDTFGALYRHTAIQMSGEFDGVSEALAALYVAMSDDAGADEASEEMEALAESELTGETVEAPAAEGPKADVVEQSGSAENTSTAQIGNTTGGDRSTKDAKFFVPEELGPDRQGRADDRQSEYGRVELGEARATALALALGVWYGEFSTTDLPATDQAGETSRARQVRAARQAAARRADGQR